MARSCDCGKPTSYGNKCRDCYEDNMRRQCRDNYDQDTGVMKARQLHKERCRMRLYKNYEGNNVPSELRGR